MSADESDEFDFSPISEPTVGMSFLEKLVLAIIDAHPVEKTDKRTRDMRLREAMHALAPPYLRRGLHGKNDRQVLHWMAAQEIMNDNIGIRLSPNPFWVGELRKANFSSKRELAALAIEHFEITGAQKKNIIDRLTKNYSDNAEMLRAEILEASEYPHLIEHRVLVEIAKLAKEAELDMRLPEGPKAFF